MEAKLRRGVTDCQLPGERLPIEYTCDTDEIFKYRNDRTKSEISLPFAACESGLDESWDLCGSKAWPMVWIGAHKDKGRICRSKSNPVNNDYFSIIVAVVLGASDAHLSVIGWLLFCSREGRISNFLGFAF